MYSFRPLNSHRERSSPFRGLPIVLPGKHTERGDAQQKTVVSIFNTLEDWRTTACPGLSVFLCRI